MKSHSLPNGWIESKVGDLVTFEYGKGLTKKQRDSSGTFPVYGSSGIVGRHTEALVSKPCLVIGRKGSIGEVYLSSEPCWPIDTTYYAIIPEFIPAKFMYHLFGTLGLNYLDKSTTIPGLNRDDAHQVNFGLPPFPEQHRIVAKIEDLFSRLDAGVETLKQVQSLLKQYRQSVLKAAVEGKLTAQWREEHKHEIEPANVLLERILKERRENWDEEQLLKYQAKGKTPPKDWQGKYKEPVKPDTSVLPELPEGWAWARAEALLNYLTSGSRGWAKYYSDEGALFLRMGNLDHDTIDLDLNKIQRLNLPSKAEGKRSRLSPGDILISLTAEVGMIGLIPESIEEAYINQHVALARPTNHILSGYLAWYLASRSAQLQLQRAQRGATKTGLGLDDIKSVLVHLPPLEEQTKIVNEVERLLQYADKVEDMISNELQRATALQQSILKQAFEGELVPQDSSDEPANMLLERIKANREKALRKKPKQVRPVKRGQPRASSKTIEGNIQLKDSIGIIVSSGDKQDDIVELLKKNNGGPMRAKDVFAFGICKDDIAVFYRCLRDEIMKGTVREYREENVSYLELTR